MSSEESSCTDVGKFCMVSALAREVDRSKHRSVYRGERDRVDAYARPRWWCCSPHQLTLLLPLSTTSSLELLINYKTSVFRSSSHDLPTTLRIRECRPRRPHHSVGRTAPAPAVERTPRTTRVSYLQFSLKAVLIGRLLSNFHTFFLRNFEILGENAR